VRLERLPLGTLESNFLALLGQGEVAQEVAYLLLVLIFFLLLA
jgi:hypothetical protein